MTESEEVVFAPNVHRDFSPHGTRAELVLMGEFHIERPRMSVRVYFNRHLGGVSLSVRRCSLDRSNEMVLGTLMVSLKSFRNMLKIFNSETFQAVLAEVEMELHEQYTKS